MTHTAPNPSATQDPREQVRLGLLARSGLLDADLGPELGRWTTALRRDTGSSVAALSVAAGDRNHVKGLSVADVAEPQQAVLPPGETLERFLTGKIEALSWPSGLPSYLEAPVVIDGHVLCTLGVADAVPRAWEERDRRVLEDVAAAVATEIRLRLASYEAQRFHELVGSQHRVHELIASGAPLREVLVELTEGIERHDPSLIPCVVLLDHAAGVLRPGAAPSLPPHYLAAIDGVVIGPNVGACGSAAWSGQLTISQDIAEDPRWAPIRDFVLGVGLRHCWSMPIKSSSGEVLGTLALYGAQARAPLPEHITLMEDGARLAGIAIERHRALEQLIYDARHDGLTGLPNRTAIFEMIDDAIVRAERAQGRAESESGSAAAVLFIDLDGLKTLNDTLGHDHADEMIREVGERLTTAVRGSDFVGRFGGDEFVVVAEDMADEAQAASLGFRLLEAISRPLPGIDTTVVTASIGITLLTDAQSDAREALRQADSAMYEAKRSGRDRLSFFGGGRRSHEGRRLALVRELRGAEKRGELAIAFQPVFDLDGVELVGVEALLRWNSPELGSVSPAEFIPVAEDSGLIVPIGAWVLRESCETMSQMVARVGRAVELSVNVSADQLSHPGFARSVAQTLAHAQWPSDQLTLEITETALVRADTIAARTLRELESAGIRIVLDDFGTGFSSLSWLKEHPVDAIKIDRSFVSGLAEDSRDQAIVSSLIGLARALGCTVTAEGVENEEQLIALRTLECERVQGFLLAHPLAPGELEALLTHDDFDDRGASAIRPTGATTDLAGLRRIARIRHLRGPVPAPSRRPAVHRRPAGR
ncbi:MAG TPA: EAL domain-containing protein [Solirubrobacteraceae bacterium]|nr:EAL domain-containing protein [Solirubrobacteraceae bacterium]